MGVAFMRTVRLPNTQHSWSPARVCAQQTDPVHLVGGIMLINAATVEISQLLQ